MSDEKPPLEGGSGIGSHESSQSADSVGGGEAHWTNSTEPDSSTTNNVGMAGPNTDGATAAQPSPGQHERPRGFARRHKFLVGLAVVLALVAGSAAGFLYWADHQIDNIPTVVVDAIQENEANDPIAAKEENERPLNILLLGADQGEGAEQGENFASVEDELADGKWTPFSHRSDTLMIAHISADRKDVQLVSIPRDTWVPVKGYPDDNGHAKINAAFAYGGPSLAVETVQDLTGIPIDHLAIIDWAGFKDLTTALGGIRVYIPETFYDTSQQIEWPQGWHEYEGQQALAYVRTRYNLPDESGDFGRIARQQNFMRATMSKLLSSGTMTNPIKLVKVINTITKYLTVDDTWDKAEIRGLALSMRSLRSDDVEFLTAPLGKYDYVGEQSIVRLAPKQSDALFEAVRDDDIDTYLDKYPKAELRGEQSIS